jgi:hypothetical protein
MHFSRRWLVALLLAWASAASVVVLPHGEALALALAPVWLGFALARFSPSARHRAIASLLALVLPLQAFAGAIADARGPGHYHSDASPHSHRQVERHHHSSEVGVIVVHDHQHAVACAEAKRLDAAVSAPLVDAQRVATAVEPESTSRCFLSSFAPDKRPPRV